MKSFALVLCLYIAAAPVAAQEMHACTVDGKKVFQDRPCKGAQIKLQQPSPSERKSTESVPDASTADTVKREKERREAYLAASEKSRKTRDTEYQIKVTENEIARLQDERDKKLSSLRSEKRGANNNLAGAVYLDSISSEMQAVAARYETDIRSKQAQLTKLQDELVALKK